MKHLLVDGDGPYCPHCGGRQFELRGALRWNPGKPQCITCGKALYPAKKSDLKKAGRL